MSDEPSPKRTPSRASGGKGVLKYAFRTVIGVVVLLLAGGFFSALVATKPEPPKAETDAARLSVGYLTLQRVDAPRVWNAFGTARAKSAAEVGAEVSGVVAERPEAIDAGVRVSRGDLIVRLEDGEYRDVADRTRARIDALGAELDSLTTELESAQESLTFSDEAVELTESEIRRYLDAQSDAGINEIEIDRLRRQLAEFRRQREDLRRQVDLIPSRRQRLEAQIAQERATLRLAELDVRRAEIRAPIDGVLQEVMVDDGERVSPGQTIARIVNLSRIEVPVRAPVSASPHIAIGDRVELTTGARVGPTWLGRIDRIAPEADRSTRTMTVFVVVEQDAEAADTLLRPGQYLSAALTSARVEPRLALPRSSIQKDRVVLLDDEDRAVFREVEVAYHLEGSFPSLHPKETQWTVVSAGVEAGERLVADPADAITAGMRLDPVPVAEEGAIGTASNGGSRDDEEREAS